MVDKKVLFLMQKAGWYRNLASNWGKDHLDIVSVCVRPSRSPGREDRHTDLKVGIEVKWKDI